MRLNINSISRQGVLVWRRRMGLVLAFGLVTFAPSMGFAQDDFTLEEWQSFQAHFKTLKGHRSNQYQDPRSISEAAEALKNRFAYLEVQQVLMDVLEEEVRKINPNSYVLNACIDALVGKISQSQTEWFDGVRTSLLRLNTRWSGHVLEKMEELERSRTDQQVEDPLPSMYDRVTVGGEKLQRPQQPMDVVSFWREQVQKLEPQLKGEIFSAIDKIASGTFELIGGDPSVIAKSAKRSPFIGRSQLMLQLADILMRVKTRMPVLTGRPGVGKTAVFKGFFDRLEQGEFRRFSGEREAFPRHQTFGLITTPAKISQLAMSDMPLAQTAAFEQYLSAIETVERALGIKIILMIDEVHTMSKSQRQSLKPFSEKIEGPSIVMASTNQEYLVWIKEDAAIERRLERIQVPELSAEETFEILRGGWIELMEHRYQVRISDEVLRGLIEKADHVYRYEARPDSSIKFIQDVAIHAARVSQASAGTGLDDESDSTAQSDPVEITLQMANEFIQKRSGIPVDIHQPKLVMEYVEAGQREIQAQILAQDHVIEVASKAVQEVLLVSGERTWRTMMVTGPTGTGKTALGEKIAETYFGSRDRFFEIDGTAFQTGQYSLNALIGAPPGIISSNVTKGKLVEFLTGDGKEFGVILINEIEKAHPDLIQRLMEMIDRGALQASDGNTYYLNRHLIILTSNRGAQMIFPKNHIGSFSKDQLDQRVRSIREDEIRDLLTHAESGDRFRSQGQMPREVLNRIDYFTMTRPLVLEDAIEIATLTARRLSDETEKAHHLRFELDPKILSILAGMVFVPTDGARPVIRKIESFYENLKKELWNQDELLAALEADSSSTFRVTIGLATSSQARVQTANDDKGASEGLERDALRVSISINGVKQEPVILNYPIPYQFLALENPKFRETLRTLEERISEELFGQEEAIRKIVHSIRAKAVQSFDPAPISAWLLGGTGTGKTEMGKILARLLYGSRGKAIVFDFGQVQHQFDFSDFFSPPKGVMGSDQPGLFEEALMAYPEGAVFIFDEINAMGEFGGKESFFHKLYDILETGQWTSPRGKTYTLSKHLFILTGNIAEEALRRAPNDDLKNEVWESLRSRSSLEELLLEEGIPEPFLNRISNIILMRPMSHSVKRRIIDQALTKVKRQLEETYRIEIVFEDSVGRVIEEGFFPVDRGARGARQFIFNQLSGHLSQGVLTHFDEIRKGSLESMGAVDEEPEDPMRVVIRASHNYEGRFWAMKEVPSEAMAEFEFEWTGNGIEEGMEPFRVKEEPSSAPKLQTREESWGIALHEAGHAVVNAFLGDPKGRVKFITIQSSGPYGGYTRFEGDRSRPLDAKLLDQWVQVLAAGRAAEQRFGISVNAGWRSDLRAIRRLVTRAYTEYGLMPEAEFSLLFAPKKPGEVSQPRLSADQLRAIEFRGKTLIADALEALEGFFEERTEYRMDLIVERVAMELMRHGTLDEAEFYNLITQNELELFQADQRKKTSKSGSSGNCRTTFNFLDE